MGKEKLTTFFKNEEKNDIARKNAEKTKDSIKRFNSNITDEEIQAIQEKEMAILIEQGKERYANADTREKIEILIKQKRNPLDTTCVALNEFRKAVEEHRPITTYSIGTTGLRNDDQIMQISFMTFEYNEEKKTYEKTSMNCNIIQADKEIIDRALENRENYDIFEAGGFGRPVDKGGLSITEEEYINGTSKFVHRPEKARDGINRYISDRESEGALFVGINPATMNKYALQAGINMPVWIDVQDVFKEYDYEEYKSGREEYLNETGDNYTFVSMCENTIGVDELFSTYQKSSCIMGVLLEIAERENLIERTKPEVKENKTAEATVSVQPEVQSEQAVETAKAGVKVNTAELKQLAEQVAMSMESGKSGAVKDERSHGNLYSDKVGDKADVVVGEVQKVGEVNIPHISEAKESKTTNELLQELIERQERTEAILDRLVVSISSVIEIATGEKIQGEVEPQPVKEEIDEVER